MIFTDDHLTNDRDDQPLTKIQPNAYRVNDSHTIEEKQLKKHYLFGKGDQHANPTEGKGAGGQKFGQENLTPAGDDKNNPSQNAGYTNAYFARTEPSEEHPEDSNFTAKNQDGSPDYSKARPYASANEPKPEKRERGNGENDRPHPQEEYSEGTDDYDGTSEPNIPGPNELPEQQKVGEDDDKDHIET
ncbi:hypothetical protein SAMN05216490_1638 [Mucilaginibacter mallensis]|uniref:Uncharacterized protein n=1 Tax=Mucilaginibacter mallensis TaxID=652787 RepID=A0A1H1UC86_MUCMA|nr:hypothetical protein [Mucilaginibacter mallensis]SDS70050.1 hypothetical protein SAMN05216490_1638 [Mucilaginibacter mallensis]